MNEPESESDNLVNVETRTVCSEKKKQLTILLLIQKYHRRWKEIEMWRSLRSWFAVPLLHTLSLRSDGKSGNDVSSAVAMMKYRVRRPPCGIVLDGFCRQLKDGANTPDWWPKLADVSDQIHIVGIEPAP